MLIFYLIVDVCIYKGQTYLQGQSWEPDCSTKCTCENAHYGYYRCNDAWVDIVFYKATHQEHNL